jgi:DnaJ-class molecular chaperone
LYDRYGSSFETMAQGAPHGAPGGAPGGASYGPGPGGFNAEDVDFSQFFGDRFGEGAGLGDIFTHFRKPGSRGGGTTKRRGGDVTSEVTIPFGTAVNGGEVQLGLQRENGQMETIVVKIPPGIEDGKKMRLRGKGEPAAARGTAGDLLLTVHIAPHPFFTRKGSDLYVRLPVTLGEAVAGASVDVPTPGGTVALHIPPGTSSGKRLRIKGHGVPAKGATGDLFAEVMIVLPANLTDADRETIRAIDARSPSNPRQNLRW